MRHRRAQPNLAAGWLTGKPLTLGSNFTFRPITAAPPSVAHPAARAMPAIPQVVAKTAQVASLVDACRAPMEEFAKTHSSFDTSLDVLGLVTATPQMWNAILQPGPKKRAELVLAGAQVGVWAAKVAADFVPGMHAAKPALMWTGVLLQAGEQVHAIIVKPTTAAGAAVKAARPRR